ncbi:hypothetical protein [Nonomuraea cavernae]|uniref:Uncharacterized protein n=1 Tax=Nonomuraea cavernae TaxID=2045107 RepID=A0A917YQK9_9ACTN|nr:hypothetical protein [Nonomuraea cavernae]MCA2184478.1 hypothetical protein [Nonomuraea cavernae]GGO63668.1 hypothetical protein GCM10012289_11270 [Nonomuraea cavernae]
MHETTAPAAPPAQGQAARVPAGLLYGLRVVVIAHAAALLVAASLAGQSVASGEALTEAHVMAGLVVHLVGLAQIVFAVLVWRPGHGAGWPALASTALFLAGMAQHVTWSALGAHLPNGVVMFGLITAVLIWVWSPRAARRK